MSRSILVEDLYRIKFLSTPRISPDGQRVAFVVTTIDERKHEYRSAIWMSASAVVRRSVSLLDRTMLIAPAGHPMGAGWLLSPNARANP
ncbi:MAG: hypothetical protein ACJ788_06540 [Ktedonobacteraceae bacterium]